MLTNILNRNLLFFSKEEDDTSGRTKAMPSIKGARAGRAYLVVVKGENFGEEHEFKEKDIIIGRSSSNDIVIKDEGVSRKHCAIEPATNSYVLKDLKSTNGTFLNDKKITSPSVLKHGDKITVGKTILQFIITEEGRGGSYTL